jgi:hypothetical protein
MMHPLWELAKKEPKTDVERVALAAVMILSTREGFTHLTPEGVFEKILLTARQTADAIADLERTITHASL